MLFDCRPKVLHKHCLQFLLGVKMAPRETENNAYAKFWGDKQRALWYVMVFLEWSMVIPTLHHNCHRNLRSDSIKLLNMLQTVVKTISPVKSSQIHFPFKEWFCYY